MKTFKPQLIILILGISCQTMIAQETAPVVSPAFKKFSIGISGTPLMGYRYLRSDGSPFLEFIFNARNDHERPKTGYSTGIQFQYHLGHKIGFELGVHYTSLGYTYKNDIDDPRRVEFLIPIDLNDPSVPTNLEYKYNWDYLEIPLKLIISPGTKKLRFSASAGMITGVLLNAWQKNIYTFSNGQETTTQQYQNTTSFRTVVFSPQVSLGATYHISPKFKVQAEPMFRYAIQTVANTPIRANLYAGGIFIGFYYNL